jgi:magnesium transporter
VSQPSSVGGKPDSFPEMVWSWWVGGTRREALDLEFALSAAENGEGFVWVGLHKPTEGTVATLGELLNIHELVIADAVHGHRRSKLEQYDENLFMVASTVSYVERDEQQTVPEIVSTGELMIILGPHWVVTSRQRGKSRMPEVRALVEKVSRDMPDGPWQVLHACLSVAIDDFVRVVGQMQDDVEDAEELVFGQTRGVEIDRPYQIKRELIEFRRCVSPLCNPLTQLAAHDFALVPDDARPYFRDLSDLVQEVRENTHIMEDQLTNILQAALALVSVNDNRDMRKISAAVAILAVPTTLGAVYGMNFDNLPELHWQYGYFALMAGNATLMLVLYLIFRRIRWL